MLTFSKTTKKRINETLTKESVFFMPELSRQNLYTYKKKTANGTGLVCVFVAMAYDAEREPQYDVIIYGSILPKGNNINQLMQVAEFNDCKYLFVNQVSERIVEMSKLLSTF